MKQSGEIYIIAQIQRFPASTVLLSISWNTQIKLKLKGKAAE